MRKMRWWKVIFGIVQSSLCLFGLVLASTSEARAGLIVLPSATDGLLPDPSRNFAGVINYGSSGIIDDATITNRSIGINNFKYFGNSLSTLTIGVNGNLSVTTQNTETFIPQSFAQPGGPGLMIAPMWDDFVFYDPTRFAVGQVGQIYETIVGQSLYAVTWSNVVLFLDTNANGPIVNSSMTTQAVLFGADQTMRGFDFRANDIAFGYTSRTGNTGDFGTLFAEIGLNSPTNQYALLPGARNANGLVTFNEAAAVVPWQPDQFVLFRPALDTNGNFQNYSVSIESFAAVPEPASILGAFSLAAAFIVRRITLRIKYWRACLAN